MFFHSHRTRLQSRLFILPLLIFAACISCSPKNNTPYLNPLSETGQKVIQAKRLRDYIITNHIPEIATPGITNLEKARILRNFVHKYTKVGNSNYELPLLPPTIEKWKKGEIQLVCSGMTMFYGNMLSAFGIHYRLVDSFLDTDPDPKFDGHSFLEVKTEKGWVIQDPTFNIEWQYKGEPIDTKTLRDLVKSQKVPVSQLSNTNNFPVISGRSLSDYHHGINELLNFYEIRSHGFYNHRKDGGLVLKTFPHKDSRRFERLKSPIHFIEAFEFDDFFLEHPFLIKNEATISKKNKTTIEIVTSEKNFARQITLKSILPKPSNQCRFKMGLKILQGGLNFGIILHNKVNKSLNFWVSQFRHCKDVCYLEIPFSSEKPFEAVDFVFLNWNGTVERKSKWELKNFKIACP